MALVGGEQFTRDSTEMKSEVMADGTLHNTINITRSRSNSLKKMGEKIETFECPPHLVQEMEQIEDILPDGSKVMRQVTMNRVIHSVKTRMESFDEGSDSVVENYEVEEVVPNTMSTFDAGVDSDYEEEVLTKRARALSVDKETEQIEEILPDGTKVMRTVTLNRVVHASRNRSDSLDPRDGHVHEDYPTEEVVPGTASAFLAGEESD